MPEPRPLQIHIISDASDQRLCTLVDATFRNAGLHASVTGSGAGDGVAEAVTESPVSPLADSEGRRFLFLSLSTPAVLEKFLSQRESVEADEFASSLWHPAQTVADEYVKAGWRVVVATLPPPLVRQFGHYSEAIPSSLPATIHRLNEIIIRFARESPGTLLCDVAHLACITGLAQWYDERFWHHAKYPCNPRHLKGIASALHGVIAHALGSVIKAVVLDLDNTLWGGVIGDDGVEGIELGGVGAGEAFVTFQRYLLRLKQRGILLCVCSKNEDAAARLPFEQHDAMALREADIACFIANWSPKSQNIALIARTLNIGLDSLMFVDDSAFEREEVRTALPQVCVPEMPEDPAAYIRFLESTWRLETSSPPSAEDSQRTGLYRAEAQRVQSRDSAESQDSYLASLGMEGTFELLKPSHLQRAAQLIQRSNQFNLRTRRVSIDELRQRLDTPNRPVFCVSLRDKFGDYGMIGVICGEHRTDGLFLDEYVMSCRVLARGVEQFIVEQLLAHARSAKLGFVIGEYLPSPKNKLVEDLFPRLGFTSVSTDPDTYRLSTEALNPGAHHISMPGK